jgi:hypothetical protein
MASRRETEAILRAAGDSAIQRYMQARAEFDSMIADFPSGLPETDGALRIRKAGEAVRFALEALNQARVNFHNFTSRGFLPHDIDFGDGDSVMAQSNRNTLEFVKRDIDLGWTFLQKAKIEYDMGEKESCDQSVRDAEKACRGARRFFDEVYSLVPGEREILRIRIANLEAAIQHFRTLQGLGNLPFPAT